MKKTFLQSMRTAGFLILVLSLCLASLGCSNSPAPAQETAASFQSADQWTPTLTVEFSNAQGATVLFRQNNDIGDSIVLCGNDYVLETYSNGSWKPLPTLTEDATWVKDAFVVTAIPREEIDWQWLYGSLAPGRYRIGKQVTLHQNTENRESATVYGEFTVEGNAPEPSIPSAEEPVVKETEETTGSSYTYQVEPPAYHFVPLVTLPADYTLENAIRDSVVILTDGSATENQEVWKAFAQRTANGGTGSVRCMNVTSTGSRFVYDVSYDGTFYTMHWMENGSEKTMSFKHMLRYQGDKYADPNASDRYVLTMNSDVTWEDIQWSLVNRNPGDAVPHQVVYQELGYHAPYAPIPESTRVTLSLRGKELITATGVQAQKLAELFSKATAMDQRPEVNYTGLDLIFTGTDGKILTVWLDLYGDHFLYDGTFYLYSTDAMFQILDIETWPEDVLFAFPE